MTGYAHDCVAPLRQRLEGRVLENEPMADHTAFRIGGPADVLVQVEGTEDVANALAICHERGVPVTVVGRGSNLLVSDDGIEGVVLQIARGLSAVRFDGHMVSAQAGTPLPALAWQAATRCLSGLEFGVMIPGSVGGALAMNAGAHHHSIAPLVRAVRCLDLEGREVHLSGEEMEFAYRTSLLQRRPDLLAVDALLELQPVPSREPIVEAMRAHLEARRRSQPLGERGAGSIFKNPPGDHAGRLIEQAGLKGWRKGDVEISPVHANFIVNKGNARCADVLEAIRMVHERVLERFGIALELEVKLLGRGLNAGLRSAAPPGQAPAPVDD